MAEESGDTYTVTIKTTDKFTDEQEKFLNSHLQAATDFIHMYVPQVEAQKGPTKPPIKPPKPPKPHKPNKLTVGTTGQTRSAKKGSK